MYKITIKYVIPNAGLFNQFDVYSNRLLGVIEHTVKDLVIKYVKEYDGIACLPESITYAKIEKVEFIKGLIYA